jgi:hypothetical protein
VRTVLHVAPFGISGRAESEGSASGLPGAPPGKGSFAFAERWGSQPSSDAQATNARSAPQTRRPDSE